MARQLGSNGQIILPPVKYIILALLQWAWVGTIIGMGVLLTFFPMGFLVVLTAKDTVNRFGESVEVHKQKYIDQGSSGIWRFRASLVWLIRKWNNYEDGLNGEPSGKHSARCGGKETSFWNQYLWLCRNPFNEAKRSSRVLACYVNDCDIDWWGTGDVSDKGDLITGWYFIRAVDRTTGRAYYGYRYVADNNLVTGWRRYMILATIYFYNFLMWCFRSDNRAKLEGTVYNAVFGYKIKPSHADEVQDADDLDKAFTLRVQFAAAID